MTFKILAICGWLDHALGWILEPITCTAPPWAALLGGLAGIIVMAMGSLLLISRLRRPRRRQGPTERSGTNVLRGLPDSLTGLAMIVAGFLLGASAGAPEFRPVPPQSEQHVVLVVDASESATRNPDGWRTALQTTRRALAGIAREPNSFGSLLLFGATVREVGLRVPLDRLLDQLATISPMAAPESDGTAPKRALQRALQIAETSSGSTRIVVVSDGLWTDDAPLAEVRQAAMRGIRIDVIPIDAGPAKLGIIAGHLPLTVDSGAAVPVRIVVAGGTKSNVDISFTRNRGTSRKQTVEVGLSAIQVRTDEIFDGRGIQFAETTLMLSDGIRQTSRLYTTVLAPPRLLVVGAAPWVNQIPKDRFEVIRQPNARAPLDLSRADVVILDSLKASEIHPDTPASLAAAIQQSGLGLFFVNGPMRGQPTDETVIGTFTKTPLANVLPVSPDRDLLKKEPPPRTVAIVIDSSGSMEGNRIILAQRIATQIVQQMSDRDSIVIDSFPPSPSAIRTPLRLTPAVRNRVLAFIAGLRASGGSNEAPGIALIQSLPSANCAAFLFSDGDVESKAEFAPGCSFNYVEIQHADRFTPRSEHLVRSARKNGDAWSISDRTATPPAIRFKYFHPPPEVINFRNERFVPNSREPDPAIAPRVMTNGVAITFPLSDSRVLLFRDAFPPDPTLAFRTVPTMLRHGEVGAFLGEIGGDWLAPQPIAALANHLERLSGWQQRDKLQIELRESGGLVRMRVSSVGDVGARRNLGDFSATIVLEDGKSIVVSTASSGPTTFEGSFELPVGPPEKTGETSKGHLHVTAGGRSDRIPIVLPIVSAQEPRLSRESYTTGRDAAALLALVQPTLGRVLLPHEVLKMADVAPAPASRPLHPVMLSLGALACLLAFMARRAKP